MNVFYCSMIINSSKIPIKFDFENIINAQGFYLALFGMLTVFIGLIVIWTMVTMNKKLVFKLQNKDTKKAEREEPDKSLSPMSMINDDNLEHVAAIIAATYAYSEEFEDDHMEILNLQHFEQEISPWVVVAREQMMRNY